LTRHAVLPGRHSLARRHCLDELFKAGVAILDVSHMVHITLRRPRESKVRRDGYRCLITLRRAERSRRRQQEERSHDQYYYAIHAYALATMLCSQTRYLLMSAYYSREQSNSLVYVEHTARVQARTISLVLTGLNGYFWYQRCFLRVGA
jgi:hypothetical protein